MTLQDRIVNYVTASASLVSLQKLLSVTSAKGFCEDEVLQALDGIGKKLKATVRGGTVYYQVPPAPKPTSTSHLEWLNANYPRHEYSMPFPDISYAHLFLKTKEARDAFMAEMKGRPLYIKNKYAK